MSFAILEFEKPIAELENKIDELKSFGSDEKLNLAPEIRKLNEKLEKMKKDKGKAQNFRIFDRKQSKQESS